jgi:hypothetical protein
MKMSGRCADGTTLTSVTHWLERSATASELSASTLACGDDKVDSGRHSAMSRLDAPGTHAEVGKDPNTSTDACGYSVCTMALTARTNRSTARRS